MDERRVIAASEAQRPAAKLTCPIYTSIGAHGTAVDLLAYARSLGLSAELESTGGWFNKSHMLTAHGSEAAVRQLATVLQQVAR